MYVTPEVVVTKLIEMTFHLVYEFDTVTTRPTNIDIYSARTWIEGGRKGKNK